MSVNTHSTRPIASRFSPPPAAPSAIRQAVESRLGTTLFESLDCDRWEYAVVEYEDLCFDSPVDRRQSASVAGRERAVARTKVALGEAEPLVVVGDENVVLAGEATHEFARKYGASHIAVYRGQQNPE
jgi:hypothetical protein